MYKNDIIASCLLIFTNSQKNYIITSTTCGLNRTINVYLLSKGNLVNKFDPKYGIYYLLDWYNKKNDKYYIICFSWGSLSIVELLGNKFYDKKEIYDSNYGFIYNEQSNYYLCFCTYRGYIGLYDLYNKIIVKFINFSDSKFNSIIQWNNKYVIVSNQNKNLFK